MKYSTFEQWLQSFNSGLHIEEVTNLVSEEQKDGSLKVVGRKVNEDIEVLYYKNKKLCTVPKGLKQRGSWEKINDKRTDKGYTSSTGAAHRSLSGIGTYLLKENIITPMQFRDHFLTARNKEYLERLEERAARDGYLETRGKYGLKKVITL